MTLYQWLFWGITLIGAGLGRLGGDWITGAIIGAGIGIVINCFFLYLTPKDWR